MFPWPVDERRLITDPILRASAWSHFSSSEADELPPLSAGVVSEDAAVYVAMMGAAGRTAFVPISRRGERGELSESE